ncbi:MAG TPA: tetratricopeptide repeat protein, partial [Gemmata sp.]|nr:tetratricopeptide repeat protein [Gemmata sp.]
MRYHTSLVLLLVFIGSISIAAGRDEPKTAKEFIERGFLEYTSGAGKKAIQDFTEALRIDPASAIAFEWRGLAKIETKDFVGAVEDLTEAIRLEPKNPRLYFNRGLAKHQMGKPAR